MAKISVDLTQFKSSGVYILEFDASENIVLNTQTIRLVVGFSRKGPFNAPVYLPDKKTAKNVYGDIDPLLERRGSFFHRSLYTCLELGPVFGLSLMPLNDDVDRGDKVPYQSFSVSTVESNGKKVWRLYSSFYNKERFWFPDEEYLLANVNYSGSVNEGKILNIVNIGQTPFTTIVRKVAFPELNVTAKDVFGSGKVPSFMKEYDFISDYFIEVIFVQGNWTDYKQLAIDPVYKNYFDFRGLKRSSINAFLGLQEIEVLGRFTGTIIPEFTQNNVNYSIDNIINQRVATTGAYVAINKEYLDNYDILAAELDDNDSLSAVDLVGHSLANPNKTLPDIINFLSYKTSIKDVLSFNYSEFIESPLISGELPEEWKTESVHYGKNYGYFDNVVCIPKPITTNPNDLDLYAYNSYKNLLIPGESLVKLKSGDWGKIEAIYEEIDTVTSRTWLKLEYSHPDKSEERPGKNIEGLPIGTITTTTGSMAMTIRSADLTTTQITEWFDLNKFPTVGQDILVENLLTKTWYYFKLRANPSISNGGTTSGSGYLLDDILTLPLEDSEGLVDLDRNSINFKIYVGNKQIVQLEEMSGPTLVASPEFVAEPGKLAFVAANTPSRTTPNHFLAYKYSKLYKYYLDGALLPGDKLYYAEDKFWYLNYEMTKDSDGITVLKVTAYDTYVDGQFDYYSSLPSATVEGPYEYGYNIASTDSVWLGETAVDDLYIYGTTEDINTDVEIIDQSWDSQKVKFSIKPEYTNLIEVGQYIVALTIDTEGTEHYSLTKVINKRKVYNTSIDSTAFEYTVNQPIYIKSANSKVYVTRFLPIDEYSDYYQTFFLEGFKITDYHLPGGVNKATQLEKILGVLDPANTNLISTLKDTDIIRFRYVVDTFDGGLNASTYPKTWLTKLAKTRQKCMAIMNTPSIKEFIDSTDPRFTEEPTRVNPKPIFNTRYVAEGGNLSLGPSYTFSLPDEQNGSKYAAYFSPFLVLREGGRNLRVPPAAHVSNAFVSKFIKGTPFAIVAGTGGLISDPKLVGLEYDFLQEDRDNLEPMGINPIIKKRNVGYMIYANQSAFQTRKSAFNNIHVRDLLITIEEAMDELLGNYVFKFNTPSVRLEIKSRVEAYLDRIKASDAIYDYTVVMDESNNTDEVINQEIGICDINIEPSRGMHKVVNRITVFGKGGISSGGFVFV